MSSSLAEVFPSLPLKYANSIGSDETARMLFAICHNGSFPMKWLIALSDVNDEDRAM